MNKQVKLVVIMNIKNGARVYSDKVLNDEKRYKRAKISEYKDIVKRKKIRLEKQARKKAIIKATTVSFVICSLIVGNLYIRAEINDINIEIREADKKITELKSKQNSLEMKLESLYSYSNLWEEAQKIGLEPRNESQVFYIDTARDDYAEIVGDAN